MGRNDSQSVAKNNHNNRNILGIICDHSSRHHQTYTPPSNLYNQLCSYRRSVCCAKPRRRTAAATAVFRSHRYFVRIVSSHRCGKKLFSLDVQSLIYAVCAFVCSCLYVCMFMVYQKYVYTFCTDCVRLLARVIFSPGISACLAFRPAPPGSFSRAFACFDCL